MISTLMFLAPPLKSSAAIRAASTEPMPLVSWKMPEISLSTPTRTTLSDISAYAGPHAAHDNASARPNFGPLIVVLPFDPVFLFVSVWVSYPFERSTALARFGIFCARRDRRFGTARARRSLRYRDQMGRP